jgi:Ca2+-binding RTX toxin-like protein
MRRVALVLAAMALALLLASGIALAVNKVGTNGPDTLRGTNGNDNLSGKGGQDDLFGKGGRDNLLGGPGKDWLLGGNERRPQGGDKNLAGGPNNDGIFAGQGSDNAQGGGGNDFMIDGNLRESSEDRFSGGPGNDVLVVNHKPAFKDLVVCGGGFDRVAADTKDVVAADCEKVDIIRSAAEEEAFFESIPQSFFRGLAPFPQ